MMFRMLGWMSLGLWTTQIYALPDSKKPEFKGIMQGIYQEMSELLPMSLNDDVFFGKKAEGKIKGSLDRLQAVAGKLEDASKSIQDEAIRITGEEFAFFTSEAATAFHQGNKPKAQALIQFQTDACMSCHTMAKTSGEPRLALNFLSKINYDNLGVWSKARFLTMARQFEKAMAEYESLLSSEELPDEAKILSTAYSEYLVLGLRVLDADDRVQNFLSKRLKAKEPKIIKEGISTWLSGIKTAALLKKPWDLKTARNLVRLGDENRAFPADNKGLVYFIYASKVLRGLLDKDASYSNEKMAELQYLLGQCELVMDVFNFKAMRYFEKAIRLAPKSALAKRALKLYEENLYINFSGSSGTHIPEEDMARLKELKKISM